MTFTLGLLVGIVVGFAGAGVMLRGIQAAVDEQMRKSRQVLNDLIAERKKLADTWTTIKEELEWKSV